MRIDIKFRRHRSASRQLFFIECWYNLCHKESIDNDRVAFNNILNAIDELLALYALGDKFRAAEKRALVTCELVELIEQDICLDVVEFEGLHHIIYNLCNVDTLYDKNRSPLELQDKLIQSYCQQLRKRLIDYYRPTCLSKLKMLLFKPGKATTEDFDQIYQVTNALMSFLISLGMPLSECFRLYMNFFLRQEHNFRHSFNHFCEKLLYPAKDIEITMTLVNAGLYNLIKNNADSLTFNRCTFSPKKSKNEIEARITVEAISFFSARNYAKHILKEDLDVISYMVGKGEVIFEKQFSAQFKGNDDPPKSFRYENEILNSSDRLTNQEFEHFIKSISRLYNNATAQTIKKISSSFRLYRNGMVDSSAESRFISYWSSLEALTLGVSSSEMSHDQHVIYSVKSCVALDYIVKQLFSLRGAIKTIKMNWIEVNREQHNIVAMNLGELYQVLKNKEIAEQIINGFDDYPYAQYKLKKLVALCAEPFKMADKIEHHINKVELQIHRLYRVRNAIVHNANSHLRLDLLIANLEHYLRSSINAMIYMSFKADSISTPEEAFVRYQHLKNNILSEMNPAYLITNVKKREATEKQITNGTLKCADTELIKWLKMHK